MITNFIIKEGETLDNDEYELLPHEQIQKLKDEVERLKYKHGSDEKDHDEFYSSIENLNSSINKLLKLFKIVEEELNSEQEDFSAPQKENQLKKFKEFEHVIPPKKPEIQNHRLKELKDENEDLHEENDLLRQRIGELEADLYRPTPKELPKFEEHQIKQAQTQMPEPPIQPELSIEAPINPRPIQESHYQPEQQMPIEQQVQYQQQPQEQQPIQQTPQQIREPQNVHDAIEMKMQQQRQQQDAQQQAQQQLAEQQRQIELQRAQEELRKQEKERIEIQEKYNAQKMQQMTSQPHQFKPQPQHNTPQNTQPTEHPQLQNYEPSQNYNSQPQPTEDLPMPTKPKMDYDPYEVQRMQQEQKQQAFQNQQRPNDLMQQPPNQNFVDPGYPTTQNFKGEVPSGQQPEIGQPIDVQPSKKKFMGLF